MRDCNHKSVYVPEAKIKGKILLFRTLQKEPGWNQDAVLIVGEIYSSIWHRRE